MCKKWEVYELESVESKMIFDYETTRKFLIEKMILKSGRINSVITRKCFVQKNKLQDLYSSIYYHTSFLNNHPWDGNKKMILRIACLFHRVKEYPKCEKCGCDVKRVLSSSNYKNMLFGKFCSYECSSYVNHPKANMTKEQYENQLVKRGETRKQKYPSFSDEWKKNLSMAAKNPLVAEKKAKTNLRKYGVSNPGVLGAYFSKEANAYIKKFLKQNNISTDRCFFHDSNLNKKEFFQFVYVPFMKKKRFFSYDLVVFSDAQSAQKKDTSKIELVLEYNGNWHYEKEDIIGCENEPAVPYVKNNTYKYTKEEVYCMDKAKLNHMMNFTENIFVYSTKRKYLYQYKNND